ncbi:cytotoxic and regulatory T-cell molecule isoform X2 [Mugil cephalus]|uniref:cytotoxic and regulatory T-cell molecule isoform X2 n=1 Tax=Mugil cephalus TaxID=48193 RepID=UPI001FB6CB5A|nr:cytotoxic and regulatory T-cell molecule isoform X2 [Mugil cephalus]
MRKCNRFKTRASATEMEGKLLFIVFIQLMQVSLAVWQRVTVMKGHTLHLKCPLSSANKAHVDWKTPEGYTMFFNNKQALKDKRYSINKLTESEFSISISNVTFKDGGNYTCSEYKQNVEEKTVEVTVLERPKLSVTKHNGKTVVKCTGEANHFPPQLSWKFDQDPEFLADIQVHHERKKYTSIGMLHVFPVKDRITVKCLLRHPALHSQPLFMFVYVGRKTKTPSLTTTTSPLSAQTQGSTGTPGSTPVGRDSTPVYSTTGIDMNGTSSESSAVNSSDSTSVSAPTSIPLNTSDSTTTSNNTIDGANSTTDRWSISKTTEDIFSDNSTEGNRTGSLDLNKHTGTKGSSGLLVFLVTFLIFCLLIVVIFFAIKLKRAHMAWKKENEDSNPSEESSKSKSSQEDKKSQGQRRRGVFNTAFTQYVVEEPTVITSVVNTAAMTAANNVKKEQTPQPQMAAQTSVKCDMKETSL